MLEPVYFGKNIIFLKTVDSTNNYSTELLKQGFVGEGTVIMAEEQTSGKGQRGNTWIAEPGKNLTCSIILSPSFLPLSDHFILTQTIALAVCDTLDHLTGETFHVKWPNDIYFNTKKISGILIETLNNRSQIGHAIAGIGINVNQDNGLLGTATSLKRISGKEFYLKDVMYTLSFFTEKRYLKLKSGKIDSIRKDYLDKLLGYQTWLNYKVKDELITGKIVGLSNTGLLQVEHKNGEIKAYDLKEISLSLD
jgi:BirA family transcriptional regulator, biotin operon repressor / biotin---[acetyl-CoA-carboxylase] ligase